MSKKTLCAGILRAARLTDYEVAAFETRDHLVFIVSDLVKEENLQISASFAPAVRDFLAKLESYNCPRGASGH